MNSSFYSIPSKKRDAIINAGFEVFYKNSYKKAPMQEIADVAGISKSLLFYYFKNKKELYLFLYDYAIDYTFQRLIHSEALESTDFFELYRVSMVEKLKMIKQYNYLIDFIMRAYFEDEESLRDDLQKRKEDMLLKGNNMILDKVDLYKFKDGIDIQMILNISMWTAEGYIKEKMFGNKLISELDIKVIEKEFTEIIDIWKKGYYKEEYL